MFEQFVKKHSLHQLNNYQTAMNNARGNPTSKTEKLTSIQKQLKYFSLMNTASGNQQSYFKFFVPKNAENLTMDEVNKVWHALKPKTHDTKEGAVNFLNNFQSNLVYLRFYALPEMARKQARENARHRHRHRHDRHRHRHRHGHRHGHRRHRSRAHRNGRPQYSQDDSNIPHWAGYHRYQGREFYLSPNIGQGSGMVELPLDTDEREANRRNRQADRAASSEARRADGPQISEIPRSVSRAPIPLPAPQRSPSPVLRNNQDEDDEKAEEDPVGLRPNPPDDVSEHSSDDDIMNQVIDVPSFIPTRRAGKPPPKQKHRKRINTAKMILATKPNRRKTRTHKPQPRARPPKTDRVVRKIKTMQKEMLKKAARGGKGSRMLKSLATLHVHSKVPSGDTAGTGGR